MRLLCRGDILLWAGDMLLTNGSIFPKTGEAEQGGATGDHHPDILFEDAQPGRGRSCVLPDFPGMLSASLFCVWSEATG